MGIMFQQWKRFWRLAEIRLLFVALLVSVIAVTSVGFFTDRADRAMSGQATQLMGGDLVIQSSRALNENFIEAAQRRGLKTARVISFPSMVSTGEKFQLVQIKAVSVNYPLQGQIETSTQTTGEQQATPTASIAEGEAWAESRLFVALGAKVGDQVQLGRSQLRLSRVVRKMPDQATSAFQFAPVLILPMAQLQQTGLLTKASRASHHLLFSGDQKPIKQFVKWLRPQLKPGETIRTLEDGLPSVQQALQRGQRFLKMASLLAVILAGAGIALSSYSLTRRETRSVAVLKTLGASRRQILERYLGQLLLSATLAAVLGAMLGYIIQFFLAISLQDFVGQELPAAGWWPVWVGMATAWIMALGFAMPQLIQLMNIAPMQIFQEYKNRSKLAVILSFIALLSGLFLLMWLQTGDLKLSLYLLTGVSLAIAVFWLLAKLMVTVLIQLGQHFRLPRGNRRMIMLVVVFGTGLFSLLLLTALQGDLISRWQASLPADAPNHFLINIQPDEIDQVRKLFTSNDIKAPFYPMILGRLVALNDKTISSNDYESTRAQRLLIREFNLSASYDKPEGNRISEGKWFSKNQKQGFSVEQGIAKTLKLKLGDRLTFDIAGEKMTEAITSLRNVQWDSMKPNFFVLAAPSMMKNKPKTFITSVYLDDKNVSLLNTLVQQFPSVTDIDISAIMRQVKDLINKAAFAVQAIFMFTLVAGIVVLFSALQSQQPERRKEIAIFKSLGASRAYLRRNLLAEFTLIGTLAGLLASLLAVIASNIAAYTLFDLSPEVNFMLVLTGTLAGGVLVGVAGYLNVRHLLKVPPVNLFR